MTAGKWLKTACNLCYINCGIEVLVNDERLEKVRGDRSSPKSQGYLFNKATRIPYYALAYVETGRAKGKVVITVAG